MAFPFDPRDVVVELFVGGTWVDITAADHVRTRESIAISRGRRNEASRPEPSQLSLQIDNSSGDYSPRNPTGQWYGSLGRNTPIRLAVRTISDSFSRTVSSGWGSTDTGQAWSLTGVGAPLLAADWAVGSGVGTMSQPVANGYRLSYLSTTSYRDVDVTIDVSLPFSDVTGAAVEPANLIVRGQSVTDYYLARVSVSTAEAVTISLLHFDGTVIAPAVVVAGLTHTSSQTLRVRLAAEGHTLRAKVWAVSAGEPYDWQVTGHDEAIPDAGFIAVRDGVASGNTNAKPIVFTHDNLEVRSPRFCGEVASWPQRWDLSGHDRWVPIEAAGIGRRLGKCAPALRSSLRRGLLSDESVAGVVAYWPCEEPARASLIASGLTGGNAMHVAHGNPQFGSNDDFLASDPLPLLKDSVWNGRVPAHTISGRAQVRFLLAVPAAGIGNDSTIVTITTSGSIAVWAVRVSNTGGLKLVAFNRFGTQLHDSGYVAYAVNGVPVYLSVEYEQIGGDVECNLVTVEPGAASGLQLPGPGDTISSQTVGITTSVQINAIGDCAVGHISVHNVWSSLFDLGDQLNAWRGETAGRRIERLCGEEAISFSHIGGLDTTAAMGPQKSDTVLNLLAQCADADLGTLFEPRGVGFCYRTRESLYRQPARLALDYSAGQISPDFEPLPDDQLTRNDIEAKRTDGSSARAVLESGPMSVLDPKDGGIGRYEDTHEANVTTDEQLPDIAGWLLSLGTVDEARYPSVTIDLTTSGVVTVGLEPQVLDLDIDDRLTIDNLPADQPPGQVSQLARGYSETINLYEHKLTVNCAPESPYQVAELDDTETRLDSDSTILNEDLDTTETSVEVAIGDGTLWTTDAGEMPFSITIGGEEMTVTAVSGSSSPQTFTVTRSVNGVVKSHDSGAEVHVTHPVILAL